MSSHSSSKIGGEYGEIRADINIQKLNHFLASRVSTIQAPVQVNQFKFGQSNPTYLLTDARGTRFVLRKKPAGQLLSKTAHQVEREYRALSALADYNKRPSTPMNKRVPVPEPIILCEDNAIIGTPFYIMEFLEGRIFTDIRMLEIPVADRRECWLSAVLTLAALGSVLPETVGLADFGPTTAYFPRQIKSLSRVSAVQSAVVDINTGQAVGEIPFYNELLNWYKKNLPDESIPGPRIVHGDFKLDNLVFHSTKNEVIGILDWELCTLGNPLADLANLTQPWIVDMSVFPADMSFMRGFKNSESTAPIPLRQLEQKYCQLTGRSYPMKEMVFVRSWMLFRLSVISQGIAARYARRQASSEHAHIHVQGFKYVGLLAKKSLEDDGITVSPKL